MQAVRRRRGCRRARGPGGRHRRHLLGDQGRPPQLSGFFAGLRVGLVVASVAAAIAPGLAHLGRSWRARVAVVGGSMEPTLRPGDWLLVDPTAYRRQPPRPGQLVVAPDPREPARELVKRVAAVDGDGRLVLTGDAQDASTDSRTFGAVDAAAVSGRPWLRIRPLRRVGPVR